VIVAGWTAFLSAFFLMVGLSNSPVWPVAAGAAAIAAMVAVVCYCILKKG